MCAELAKFIPSEIRLKIAQSVVKEKGIRPLAREIGVNPKSVYKYKEGTANPGDEVMSKILAVAEQEDSIKLEEYLKELKSEFLEALELSFEPKQVLTGGPEEQKDVSEPKSPTAEEKKGVVQESTDQRATEKSVDEKSTLTVEEVYNRIGVKKPFNRSKVEKIIGSFSESSRPNLNEIVELSGLSEEATEKYLEKLASEKIVNRDSQNTYSLSVEIERGD